MIDYMQVIEIILGAGLLAFLIWYYTNQSKRRAVEGPPEEEFLQLLPFFEKLGLKKADEETNKKAFGAAFDHMYSSKVLPSAGIVFLQGVQGVIKKRSISVAIAFVDDTPNFGWSTMSIFEWLKNIVVSIQLPVVHPQDLKIVFGTDDTLIRKLPKQVNTNSLANNLNLFVDNNKETSLQLPVDFLSWLVDKKIKATIFISGNRLILGSTEKPTEEHFNELIGAGIEIANYLDNPKS